MVFGTKTNADSLFLGHELMGCKRRRALMGDHGAQGI